MQTELIRDVTDKTIPCPFCGNDENKYRSLMAIHLAVPIHYVKCESCAACGPISVEYPDEESAIEGWNKRAVVRPIWWPENPYPKDVFTMTIEEYKEAIPDENLRTSISAALGHYFWELASSLIRGAMENAAQQVVAVDALQPDLQQSGAGGVEHKS